MDQKPRSDAKLLNLPEEQQAQLADWLLGGMPYYEAQKQVEAVFGVTVKSLSAFSQFYYVACRPHLLRRRSQAATMAEEVGEEARKSPNQFDEATIDAIRQKAFELSISPTASAKDVKSILMLVLKARDQDQKVRDQDLKERAVVVSEKKVAMLEAQLAEVRAKVATAKTGGLTPEALAEIEQAAKIL